MTFTSNEERTFAENYDIAAAAIRSNKGTEAIHYLQGLFRQAVTEIDSLQESRDNYFKQREYYEVEVRDLKDQIKRFKDRQTHNNHQTASIKMDLDVANAINRRLYTLHSDTMSGVIRSLASLIRN